MFRSQNNIALPSTAASFTTPLPPKKRTTWDLFFKTCTAQEIYEVAKYGNLNYLLEKYEADTISAPDSDGKSPLRLAVIEGNTKAVNTLVKANTCKTHIDAINGEGITPLNLAIESGYTKIVAILIRAGANAEGRYGWKDRRNALEQAKDCLQMARNPSSPFETRRKAKNYEEIVEILTDAIETNNVNFIGCCANKLDDLNLENATHIKDYRNVMNEVITFLKA